MIVGALGHSLLRIRVVRGSSVTAAHGLPRRSIRCDRTLHGSAGAVGCGEHAAVACTRWTAAWVCRADWPIASRPQKIALVGRAGVNSWPIGVAKAAGNALRERLDLEEDEAPAMQSMMKAAKSLSFSSRLPEIWSIFVSSGSIAAIRNAAIDVDEQRDHRVEQDWLIQPIA